MDFFKIFQKPLDKQETLRKSHGKLLQKDALDENEALLQYLPIVLKIASMVSIITTIGYLNFTFWGNASLFQLLTLVSLAVAILVEIAKNFFYEKTFLGYFSQKLASRDPKNHKIISDATLAGQALAEGQVVSFSWSSLFPKIIGMALAGSLSFYLSINGIKYMEAGFTNEIVDIQNTTNVANLDSINAIFDNKIAIVTQKSEGKIAGLKNEISQIENSNKDLWSPLAKANSKRIVAIQDQIGKEQDRLANQISQIENEQRNAINSFLADFEKQNQIIKEREISQIKAKGNDFSFLTILLELASLVINFWLAKIDYDITSQQLDFNQNLPTVQNPTLLKTDNNMTHQVIRLNTEVEELKSLVANNIILIDKKGQEDHSDFQ